MPSSDAPLWLRIGRRTLRVASVEDASARYAAERDRRGAGSSRFPEGELVLPDGEVLRVSYNGRVWRGDWPQAELVHDPAAERVPG